MFELGGPRGSKTAFPNIVFFPHHLQFLCNSQNYIIESVIKLNFILVRAMSFHLPIVNFSNSLVVEIFHHTQRRFLHSVTEMVLYRRT